MMKIWKMMNLKKNQKRLMLQVNVYYVHWRRRKNQSYVNSDIISFSWHLKYKGTCTGEHRQKEYEGVFLSPEACIKRQDADTPPP